MLAALGVLSKKVKLLQIVPPQLIVVVLGVALGDFVNLGGINDGSFLIKLPETPFHGIHAPNFAALLARQDLWYAAILGVVKLTMIDGV